MFQTEIPGEDLVFPAWMKSPPQAWSTAGVEGDTDQTCGLTRRDGHRKNNWHFYTDGSYSPCFADRKTDLKRPREGPAETWQLASCGFRIHILCCWTLNSRVLMQLPSQSAPVAGHPLTLARMTRAGHRN